MRICVIAGGVGSARFVAGLVRVVDPNDVTIVVNTGDDARMSGLHVSPDVDTILYHLSGRCDWERGWGVSGETYRTHDRYAELVSRLDDRDVDLHEWFTLGDLDVATNLLRARLLDVGRTLTQAIDGLRRALGVSCRVLPMSDDAVSTVVIDRSGSSIDFQTYFVKHRHADEVTAVSYDGAAEAVPAEGVLAAIARADVVVIPPSNPVLSIAPILAVPGVRDAIASSQATRIAVSPIVGGRALKGPADRVLASLGHEVSPVGVAQIYTGVIDAFVIDDADAVLVSDVEALGVKAIACDTIMSSPEAAARLAKVVLGVA